MHISFICMSIMTSNAQDVVKLNINSSKSDVINLHLFFMNVWSQNVSKCFKKHGMYSSTSLFKYILLPCAFIAIGSFIGFEYISFHLSFTTLIQFIDGKITQRTHEKSNNSNFTAIMTRDSHNLLHNLSQSNQNLLNYWKQMIKLNTGVIVMLIVIMIVIMTC